MGFFFRKSIKLGPIRLNASKSGLGISTGIRGARVGINSRGRAYVHCGLGGFYYRSSLGGATARAPQPRTPAVPRPRNATLAPIIDSTVGEHREIESADVSSMAPETAASLLAELKRRNGIFSWDVLFCAIFGAAALMAFASESPGLGSVFSVIGLVGTIALVIVIRRLRTVQIDYDFDDAYGRRYASVIAAFNKLRLAQRTWVVESQANVNDRKYHAGASSLIKRTRVTPVCLLPGCIKSNVKPPMFPAGRQRLYLMPDRILVYEGRKVGAVEYDQLRLEPSLTRFIEDGIPPTDAQQVDTTWKYVNKKGGPDRRFKDNRQLPIMQYAELRWWSASGLNELHQISAPNAVADFVQAVAGLAARKA